jgi:hypothetical protein
MDSLEPVPALQPVPITANSWNVISEDGSRLINLQWKGEDTLTGITSIDVDRWEVMGTFEPLQYSALTIHHGHLYTYDRANGQVLSMDLDTGEVTTMGEWPRALWLWDDLHVLSDGAITALGTDSSRGLQGEHSVFILHPETGETAEVPIGPIERINPETGIFDGDYEIPDFDSPGVVWGDDQLYIAHAEGPGVTVVDLHSNDVVTHNLEVTSWLDRLLAFWMPSAAAKGPQLGTYSSAALSPDGRFLLISGNRYDVVIAEDESLVEENEHLGSTVVDTDTWQVVARPELPIQFVRSSGNMILAVDTVSTSPWIDDYYVASVEGSGELTYQGPVTIEGGFCQPIPDPSRLVCSEYTDVSQSLKVVDLANLGIVEGPTIGQEDQLHQNGVLEDWTPLHDG